MHWEQSLPIVSSKRNPPLNLNLSMTGNYKCSNNYIELTLIFKGVGRHPKNGKKKGGIKVHTVIHANEGVPSDIRFTSAATNDSFMLKPR